MAKSSNASPSSFGLEFQSYAAIVLMIKNIKEASKIRVEGAKQDIEITLNNGNKIYSQVKSVNDIEDYSNVLTKLKEALKTLNDVSNEPNIESLIYLTNSPNPFNSIRTMYAYSSSITMLKYETLDSISRNKIEGICKKCNYNFDKELLSICVLQFHGDGENRYKTVKDIINEFLGKIEVGDRGLGQKMLEIWYRDFSINSSQRKLSTIISKQQMIWPLIVLLCEINREDSLLIDIDNAEFEEIKNKYGSVISNNTERFTFITKVISSYNIYKKPSNSENKEKSFIEKYWHDFKNEFDMPSASSKIIEYVTKLSIGNVIKNRFRISDIQKAVKL
jgi:hypothetical protein